MKIAIVSDSHDRAEALAQAVQQAAAEGARAVLHCGDLIGANTVRASLASGIPIHLIHGNNLGDPPVMLRLAQAHADLLTYHGADARLELAGRHVFVVHYPEYGYAMACTGEWDLVCCGHDHRASVQRVRSVKGDERWLVNPGTVAGLAAPPTWILGDLAHMHFEIRTLAG